MICELIWLTKESLLSAPTLKRKVATIITTKTIIIKNRTMMATRISARARITTTGIINGSGMIITIRLTAIIIIGTIAINLAAVAVTVVTVDMVDTVVVVVDKMVDMAVAIILMEAKQGGGYQGTMHQHNNQYQNQYQNQPLMGQV
jgi:hypothetical protein